MLGSTVALGQSETSKIKLKGDTLKVEEVQEAKLLEKKEVSKIKANIKTDNSNAVIVEQKLIEKRKNLGVIELSQPEEVLTPEK